MLNEIVVNSKDLNALTQGLKDAYKKYRESYNQLEEGLIRLTQKGFTGDAAAPLMASYNNKVKPNAAAIIGSIDRAIGIMEEETAKFNSTMSSIIDRVQ